MQRPVEVFEHIYQIKVPLPDNPLKELNAYLVKGVSAHMLVDTGFRRRECYEALMSGLDYLGIGMKQTDIFLTHSHADHSGLAPDIRSGHRKIYVGKNDISRLKVPERQQAWRVRDAYFISEGMPDALLQEKDKVPGRKYACKAYEEYVPLKEGCVLEYGNYKFQCISTPGHSPGHMCLYEPDKKIMILGDHVLFDITSNITSWSGVHDSLGQYLESLDKVKKYAVKTALPGHRSVNENIYERIEMIKKHHGQRLSEILKILDANPGINGYGLTGKMKWNMRCSDWEDFPSSQKSYAMGEALAHLDYLRIRGYIKRIMSDGIYHYYVENRIREEIIL